MDGEDFMLFEKRFCVLFGIVLVYDFRVLFTQSAVFTEEKKNVINLSFITVDTSWVKRAHTASAVGHNFTDRARTDGAVVSHLRVIKISCFEAFIQVYTSSTVKCIYVVNIHVHCTYIV